MVQLPPGAAADLKLGQAYAENTDGTRAWFIHDIQHHEFEHQLGKLPGGTNMGTAVLWNFSPGEARKFTMLNFVPVRAGARPFGGLQVDLQTESARNALKMRLDVTLLERTANASLPTKEIPSFNCEALLADGHALFFQFAGDHWLLVYASTSELTN